MMAKLSETELKRVIKGGETNTVELKVAAPRATEMAERLCGLANAQGGMVIIGVEDASREGEVQSKLRNPTLANLLQGIPGYMERLGSGIRFMLDETQRLGLPAPQFREMNEFIVTFPKAQALLTPQEQPQYRGSLWGDEHGSLPEIPAQSQSDQRERRLAMAMEYVQEYGFITNSIYRQLTGATERTAHRDLETLIERGRLRGTGQRAARRYVLS